MLSDPDELTQDIDQFRESLLTSVDDLLDIFTGHWDMRDMRQVLVEAHPLVEHGLVDDAQFRAFVFDNPVRLCAAMNPDFFRGTVVESAVLTQMAS